MKFGVVIAILLAPAALLAAGRATEGKAGEKAEKAELSKKTEQNLEKAMKGEALAHAKYLLYANQARENGREDLAELYEATARTEEDEHLKEQAKLARTVGDDEKNLRDAIQGETHEAETMYPEMAREARKSGDIEAARRFEELARDEKIHRDRFQQYLDKFESLPRREPR